MSEFFLGMITGGLMCLVLVYFLLRIAARILVDRLEANLDNLEEAVEKHIEETAISCRVELHDEMFFVYNNDTNEFMAQGKDLLELRARVKDRWTNKKISVVAGEESVLEKLRTQAIEAKK